MTEDFSPPNTMELEAKLEDVSACLKATSQSIHGLLASETRDEAIEFALDTLLGAFDWYYGAFWRLEDDELVFAFDTGFVAKSFSQYNATLRLRRGVGVNGRALASGTLEYIEDLCDDDSPRAEAASEAKMHSTIAIPLYCHDEIVGVIDLMTSDLAELQDHHHDTIQGVTFGLKNSLERIIALAEQHERTANAQAINTLLQRFQDCSSQNDVIDTALQGVCEVFGWDASTYWRVDPDLGVLVHESTFGEITPAFDMASKESTFEHGVGINGRAWKSRTLIYVPELGQVEDCMRAGPARRAGVHAAVCFPVIVRGEVIGTIDFLIRDHIEFSEERLITLESMAHLISSTVTDFYAEDLFQEQSRDIDALRQFVESQRQVTDPRDVIEGARRTLEAYLETSVTFSGAPHSHHSSAGGGPRVTYTQGKMDVVVPLQHDDQVLGTFQARSTRKVIDRAQLENTVRELGRAFELEHARIHDAIKDREFREGINHLMGELGRLARGNLVRRDGPTLPAQLLPMEESIRTIAGALQSFEHQLSQLIDACSRGELEARADHSKLHGVYAAILDSANVMLATVARPVDDAVYFLEALARGESPTPPNSGYQGSFGMLERAIRELLATNQDIITAVSSIARGDLTVTLQPRSEDDALITSLNQMLEELNTNMHRVLAGSEELSMGAKLVSETSEAVADIALENAGTLQDISDTLQIFAQQNTQTADSASEALAVVAGARDAAHQGKESMEQMQTSMAGIEESSQAISSIIRLIDEIAFQTNLLALNAAVEAARAGVHGKGFAVVAEEVRNLAERSAKAAKETSSLIQETIKKVNNGLEVTEHTAEVFEQIAQGVDDASQLTQKIAESSSAQVEGIETITEGIHSLDVSTQRNSATAEEMAAASHDLRQHVDGLRASIERFELATPAQVDALTMDPDVMRQFMAFAHQQGLI